MPKQRLIIDNFLGGLAPSPYIGNETMSDPSNTKGWEALVYGEENILQRGMGTASLTNASYVTGYQYNMKVISDAVGQRLFTLGDNLAGNSTLLHKVDLITDTVANSSPWPWTTAGSGGLTTGLEFYDGYLYYATGSYLGRYNLSLTFDNSFNFSLTSEAFGSQIWHPMVQGNGKLFVGNSVTAGGACVTSVSGDLVTLVDLDLSKTAKIIKALEFNDNTLYIAASSNYNQSNTSCETSLFLWDTVSGSWQKEYKFPENEMSALKIVNGTLYCWGSKGFYRFNGGNFDLIRTISGGPGPGGTDVTPNGILLFKDGTKHVYSYGTDNPAIPALVQKPINDASISQYAAIKSITLNKLYIGGSDSGPNLRVLTTDGTGRLAGEWRTTLINLGHRVRIVKLYVVAQPLPTGCEVSFSFIDDNNYSVGAGTWSTAAETTFEYQPNGAVYDTFQLRILHTANTASPKFKKFVIEYELEKE